MKIVYSLIAAKCSLPNILDVSIWIDGIKSRDGCADYYKA